MQNKVNLMNELNKVRRVADPHLTLFVGDSLAGNDAVEQARMFQEIMKFDGAVLTKVDTDAKGGAGLSIAFATGRPIVFAGIGQGYHDLKQFDLDWLLEQMFNRLTDENIHSGTSECYGRHFKDEETEQFFQLVHMFQRSALLNIGMIPDQEGNMMFNLGEAKAGIDLLRAQSKTSGNLTDQEERMLKGIVSELQLQFLKAPTRQRNIESDAAQSETIREAFANPKSGPVEDLSPTEESEE